MTFFQKFYQHIAANRLCPWLETLPSYLSAQEQHWLNSAQRNNLLRHQRLPALQTQNYELLQQVRIGQPQDISSSQQEQIYQVLQTLKPWRKGPFELFGVQLDTEWRSDWKWDRILPHIQPLKGRYVLDVGCGSGYHLWRMSGAGAKSTIGIDPMPLFFAQYLAIRHFLPHPDVYFLPLGIDDLPAVPLFDTVFSLGVLYHRRSPIDFLHQLKAQLVPGGELVLETLVIEGSGQDLLMPEERYAKMRNVWFIPSVEMLQLWLQRCGFKEIRLVDLNQTSTEEQRRTAWMEWESLADFLDPADSTRTIEGYPAPLRATLLAQK